ncbi:MAG: pur operon repressor [Synergistaceae bacterium]|nr:phosphoribosyltransferase family protein [Synergistota bacterium]NLM70869.1 pur operon repressor [Synergistaceae bacterium]
MRGQRTERLIRIATRFLTCPSRQLSLTSLAEDFLVSKTVISDDVTIIDESLAKEGLGGITVDRGRTGGAFFVPRLDEDVKRGFLEDLVVLLNDEERFLPGGMVYYSDILFNPHFGLRLGYIMASLFSEMRPDIVMTSEVKGIPLALFTAHAMGIPLAVCRFRNRASDGSAVTVHYPTKNGEIKAMYMGTKQLSSGKKVVIIDDFMRGGSTAAGMLLVAKEFGVEVVGTGVFIVASEPSEKAVASYRALLRLESDEDGKPRMMISDEGEV